MELNQDVVVFIIRKVFLVIGLLFYLYKVIKNKKIKSHDIFSLPFILFLAFTRTFIYNLDFWDKLIILILYPTSFFTLSFLFFKYNEVDRKERNKYIIIFIFFVIVELLYIYRGKIFI